jgi:exosortase A-associated hydrolase 2
LPDCFGTGDSEGDFADATIETWRADLDMIVARVLNDDLGHIVALRGGALLAADLAGRRSVDKMTLIQPVASGGRQLDQFLRLGLAASFLGKGPRLSVSSLRQRLREGETLEVAGYRLAPKLAEGLVALDLSALVEGDVRSVRWVELAALGNRSLLPASRAVVDRWLSAGLDVSELTIPCVHFWASQEIVRCPLLVETICSAG